MKIQPFIEKLNSSEEYKEFKKKYSDAFLAAGFFVMDLEAKTNISQIDYYIPSEKKFAAFTLGNKKFNVQIIKSLTEKAPEKMEIETKIDLEEIPGILEDEMKNRSITEDIKKIIAVVQNVKGKKIWNINSVLSGMDILRAHIEDTSETILKMEKTSFVEIMKKMPMDQMQMPKGTENPFQQGKEETEINSHQPQANENPDEAIGEIQKLDKLEKKIEEEKSRLKKEIIDQEKKNAKENSKVKIKKK